MSKITKLEKIYEYLENGGELTKAKARSMFGVRTLSDTTYRLRKMGAPICCTKVTRGKRTSYVHRMSTPRVVGRRNVNFPPPVRLTGYSSLMV